MRRKVVAVWVSLLIMVSSIVILVEIAERVKAPSTFYVGGAGGGNYSKIQWAIDNASNGDTVYVYNGTYYENVVVNKTINLNGENINTTIIDGGGSGDVVRITKDQVNVTGFTVTGGGSGSGDAGIQLEDVQYCEINDSNVISNNRYGIYVWSSSNNSILYNNVSNNWFAAIRLRISHYNNIKGNNISSNNWDGILLESSSNNTIANNTISSNNGDGIYIDESCDNNFTGNNFFHNGILIWGNQLSHYNSHNIPPDNLVNGKPIYYYKNTIFINIDSTDVGQLILANCSDFDVRNLEITDTEVGIQVGYSTNIDITNNNLSSNDDYGIYFWSSSNGTIKGNDLLNNYRAVWFDMSTRNNLSSNNILFNSNGGIIFSIASKNNIIVDNNITDNWEGIRLASSSNGNTIMGNNVSSNNLQGIYLSNSKYNNITNNDIFSNNGEGIILKLFSNENIIMANNISSNSGYGIQLDSTPKNNITKNNFTPSLTLGSAKLSGK